MKPSILRIVLGWLGLGAFAVAQEPPKDPVDTKALQAVWAPDHAFTRIDDSPAFSAAVGASVERAAQPAALTPAQLVAAREATMRFLLGYHDGGFDRYWAFRSPTGCAEAHALTDAFFADSLKRLAKELRAAGRADGIPPHDATVRGRAEAVWRLRERFVDPTEWGTQVFDSVALSEIRVETLDCDAPLARVVQFYYRADFPHYTRRVDGAPIRLFDYLATRRIAALRTSYGPFTAYSAATARASHALLLLLTTTVKMRTGIVTPVYVLSVWEPTTFVPVEVGAANTGEPAWIPVF